VVKTQIEVTLKKEEIDSLDEIASIKHVSRDSLIQKIIRAYINDECSYVIESYL
jgi:metal-responsive CopG/Arc/MetJ family transcriptional regulator